MIANPYLKSIFIFILFLILTGIISTPFFVLYNDRIRDYMSIFMLSSSVIILLYEIRNNNTSINLNLRPDKTTLITLLLVLFILTLEFLSTDIIADSIIKVSKDNLVLLFSIIVIGPLAEEIIFRQLMFNQLFKEKGFWKATLFTSVIFALIHINLDQIIPAFFTSIILSYNFFKKESILEVYLLHSLSNFVAVFVPYCILI